MGAGFANCTGETDAGEKQNQTKPLSNKTPNQTTIANQATIEETRKQSIAYESNLQSFGTTNCGIQTLPLSDEDDDEEEDEEELEQEDQQKSEQIQTEENKTEENKTNNNEIQPVENKDNNEVKQLEKEKVKEEVKQLEKQKVKEEVKEIKDKIDQEHSNQSSPDISQLQQSALLQSQLSNSPALSRKVLLSEFLNLPDKNVYKSLTLGGEQYNEEDFKLIHISKDINFFKSICQLTNCRKLTIRFQSAYGSAGVLKNLVDSLNQLQELTSLNLNLTPNADLLNQLVDYNETLKQAKTQQREFKQFLFKIIVINQKIQVNVSYLIKLRRNIKLKRN